MTSSKPPAREPRTGWNYGPKQQFVPIRQQRAHEYVAEQIRRHIGLRLVAPGESLPSERELATIFGVGRVTVQQALRILESEHLVESRRGRSGGTFVIEPSEDSEVMEELAIRLLWHQRELYELLDYRLLIEPAVCQLAAQSRRNEDLQRIRQALDGMASASTESDYMRLDTDFHIAIAGATRNRYLTEASERIRSGLNDALSLLPESATWHRQLSAEHEAIFTAIAQQDSASAESASRLHVENSNTGVRAVLSVMRSRVARRPGR
jgi:GntR family transcriptional regulator, transcriptional repressor for pyruvate dehydrogenase complex